MSSLWRICIIIVFLIIQTGLFIFHLPDYLIPNLAMILIVVWLVLLDNFWSILILAFVAGLFLDALSNLFIGSSAIILTLIALAVFLVKKKFFIKKTFWAALLFGFSASIFFQLLLYIGLGLFNIIGLSRASLNLSPSVIWKVFFQAVVNTIFCGGIYFLLKKTEKG